MTLKPRILVVDDEPATVKLLSANLKARGYEVLAAGDGLEALKVAQETLLDLIVLDLGLPGMDGFEVCAAVRRDSQVPILVLSARGRERDKVQALDQGADDYLTKPFGVEELLARVRALLRRSAPAESIARTAYEVGDLRVDFENRRVTLAAEAVDLTPIEYRLLAHLALNAGKVLSYRALLQAVWGPEYGDEKEYVWTYMRRLRHKLGDEQSDPRYLLTEPGVGYRLASF